MYIKVEIDLFFCFMESNLMIYKELAMKRDRSLRRIEDEKTVRKIKQNEIDFLQKEIDQMQEEKFRLEKIIRPYQSHLNLLIQVNKSLRFFRQNK